MSTFQTFEEIEGWQKARELTRRVYDVSDVGAFSRDFGLRDQMRRAAVSILTNIAEGFERASRKEYLLFLNIAKGSAGECRSLCRVALEIGYFSEATHQDLHQRVVTLSRFLFNQINSIKRAPIRQ